jgi:hypothetical protein
MSKIKLLLDVVSDMRSLADSLNAVADALAGNESAETAEPTVSAEEPKPMKTEKSKMKEITLEEVRAALAVKSQAGLTTEVREIIKKYGGSKLSEIAPEHYAGILKDAEGIGNG